MEQVKTPEARVANTLAVLKLIEEEGARLLKAMREAEADKVVHGELLDEPQYAIRSAVNYAWAMRTLPSFDVQCLSRLKEQEIEFEDRSSSRIVKRTLFVPAFAWMSWQGRGSRGMEIMIGSRGEFGASYHFSNGRSIVFDADIFVRKNEAIIGIGGGGIRLTARAPEVPASVQRRVGAVEGRFDSVNLVWEAEWTPRPLADPLVIGSIFGQHFLIDQYDVTKLERYIASEFCTKREGQGESL
jgi:hypothetical protein